jgi:hypothetical protein
MGARPPERNPIDDGEGTVVPSRFYLQLTLGGFLLAVLVFANALPGIIGLPLLTLAVPTPNGPPPATMLPLPTATVRPLRVEVSAPAASPQVANTPTPAPVPERMVVGNTNGDGVALRRTPKLDDRLVAWQDGSVMEVIGPDATGDGLTWRNVRDPKGNTGYIPAQYLVPLTGGR